MASFKDLRFIGVSSDTFDSDVLIATNPPVHHLHVASPLNVSLQERVAFIS
jgi:hypothetical protein